MSDTTLPIHILTYRTLLKDRETAKALALINTAKDSIILAYEQRARIWDSLRAEFVYRARLQSLIEVNQLEKQAILQEQIDKLTAALKRRKLAPWLSAGVATLATAAIAILLNR